MAGDLRVWFDFLCPWARIGTHWLSGLQSAGALEAAIEWKAFSLEHVNLDPDSDPDDLWATAPERRGLLPLAAAKWAQANRPDAFESVRRTVFDARHLHKEKIGRPDVLAALLGETGLDGETVVAELTSDRRWLDAARADHEQGAELGVFGVPTLGFPGMPPRFVRVVEIPEGDRAVELWQNLRTAATDPLIHEMKSP